MKHQKNKDYLRIELEGHEIYIKKEDAEWFEHILRDHIGATPKEN